MRDTFGCDRAREKNRNLRKQPEQRGLLDSRIADRPTLTALARDLWAAELHVHKLGAHLRSRMVVARLPGGGLWLHSPIVIDDELAEALAQHGDVEHIVAPNCFHHLHAGAAKQRYPNATLWAAPGLAAKRRDLEFDADLDDGLLPWGEGLQSVHLRGVPKINEVVFFHAPTRTLICSDFLFNIRDEPSWASRTFYRMLGVYQRVGTSRAWRWWTRDHTAASAAAQRVLQWDIRRIVMGHGDVIEHDCAAYLEDAVSFRSDKTDV